MALEYPNPTSCLIPYTRMFRAFRPKPKLK